MSEQDDEIVVEPGSHIYVGYVGYIVTSVTVTVDEATGLPATLQVDALSVIEVEKREAEYAAMLRPSPSSREAPEP